MADVFVMIRSQDNVALTSISGIAFVTVLKQDGQILAEERVDLIYADAGFDDLSPGKYTVTVRHAQVEPQEANYDLDIKSNDNVVFLKFVYLEPERVLLRIEVNLEERL